MIYSLTVVNVSIAFVLDLIFGDPHWFPHPVKAIGFAISKLEPLFRKWIANETLAGGLSTIIIVTATYGITWLLLNRLSMLNETAGQAGNIFIIYTCLSVRSLSVESSSVLQYLEAHDLQRARQRLDTIVGRDTENLEPKEIIRGTVETIAENTVDGVISPMFFAFLGGAPLALAYKAVNTLDSMIGHKDTRCRHFGKLAARLDDAANFIPARMAMPVIGLAAFLIGLDFKRALVIALRDGRKHPSPNAGIPEAAFAGALSVQLGGLNYYKGIASPKPLLGECRSSLQFHHIRKAQQLMLATSILTLLILSTFSLLF